MGHRFKGKPEDEDAPEKIFLRSEIERKEDSEIERKACPEKTPEEDSLRLKIERKGLRSEIERTVLCTKAEQSYDIQGVQVQEDLGEETKDPFNTLSELSEKDQDARDESSPDSSLNEEVFGEGESITLQHQWFIDSFSSACLERGVEADLTLSSSLASSLDDWLDQRLSKRSYLGNRCFYDETVPRTKDKIYQIVTQWEFMKISYLGKGLPIPAVPDLVFLVTYREQIFAWVSEQRQRSLDKIFARFETKEQAAPAAYTH
jgi:hypothetical protein